jgi:hypothetical protein
VPLELKSALQLAVSSSPELLRCADPLRKASRRRHRLCAWVDPLVQIVASPTTSRCKPRAKPCSGTLDRVSPVMLAAVRRRHSHRRRPVTAVCACMCR